MYIIYVLLTAYLTKDITSTIVIPNVKPTNCTEKQYFQYSSLRCIDCGTNQQRSSDFLSCDCDRGSRITSDYGGPTKVCSKCPNLEVVSSDGWNCVKCVKDSDYISTTRTCNLCSANSVSVDRSEDGTTLIRKSCLKCALLTSPGTYERVCKQCHPQTLKATGKTSCSCAGLMQTGGVCFPLSTSLPRDLPNSYVVDYHGLGKLSSSLFKEHLRAAKGLCQQNRNYTACQLLGNLCVLIMYNREQTVDNACKQYLSIVSKRTDFVGGIKDWPVAMPWLYYSSSATEVLDKSNVNDVFTRRKTTLFSLVSYSSTGQFLGILNDLSVLQLCPSKPSIASAAIEFSTTYVARCKLKVADLVKTDTIFYDVFLQVNGNKGLYPIPVLVSNYVENGDEVNRDSNRTSWKLTRRFFLVDSVSGKTSNIQPLTYIQYASSIELVYRLRADGKIYPPLLKIRYSALKVDETMQQSEVTVEFKVSYEMDTTKIDENIKIALGVISTFGIVYAMVRIVGWRRREGLLMLDGTSYIYFLIHVCSALVLVFLAILFVTCIQWLFFFKLQTIVIRVLPTSFQENLIKGMLIAAFVMKTIDVLYILHSQIYVDIFFIDWERPRGSVSVTARNSEGKTVSTPVSIMRTLFVANEWREIQTIRRIKPTLQIILVVLFFNAVGFEYWTTTDPFTRLTADKSSTYVGETNLCLRLGVVCLLYFVIAIVQWIVFGFLYERFVADAIGDFIDFCSMCNISVFLMSHSQFGYYIHGRSVHGRSDTSLHELYEQFQREEDNLCCKRGLEPNTDLQTFEMALTAKFRNEYSKIVEPLLDRDIQGARRGQSTQSAQNPVLPGSSLSLGFDRSVRAYRSINKYLASFVEHAVRDNDYMVKDKLLLEKLLHIELTPPAEKGVFYKDDGNSFVNVLLYGQEWNLLIFNLLLFLLVDWVSGWNSILAAVIAYFVDILIVTVRNSLGAKNISSKTMMDERFLI